MGFLPRLTAKVRQEIVTQVFGGYDHRARIQDGEMYEMTNLAGDNYPTLSPRNPRGIVRSFDKPTGMIAKGKLAICDGQNLWYGDELVEGITLSEAEDMCPKKMVSLGAYLLIWPDKVYVNTLDLTDCGEIGVSWTNHGEQSFAAVEVVLCDRDGNAYNMDDISVSVTAPTNPRAMMMWINPQSHEMKRWTAEREEWVPVTNTYVRLGAAGIGAAFKQWDAVKISGMGGTGTSQDELLEKMNAAQPIYAAGDNWICIAGMIEQRVMVTARMELKREAPDLDYVTECDNRLWGCKYGMVDGVPVNEIHACKLGDFKNWDCYMGLSTDSYTVSVGTDGPFTGAATLKSWPVFFKEGAIHRISGTMPSNYQMLTTQARGVQNGSWRSIARVGENLMYKGVDAVLTYDGSVPYAVSEALGDVKYYDGIAGADGDRYYIAMHTAVEVPRQFMLDTKTGRWYVQENFNHGVPVAYAATSEGLYMLGPAPYWPGTELPVGEPSLWRMDGREGVKEAPVEWRAVFGPDGLDMTAQKYLARYNIRMSLEPGSRVEMWLQYDVDKVAGKPDKWHKVGEMVGRSTQTFLLPVLPRRCDHCTLMLKGVGPTKIYSISRIIEGGGDG